MQEIALAKAKENMKRIQRGTRSQPLISTNGNNEVTPMPTYASIQDQIEANKQKIKTMIEEARIKRENWMKENNISTLAPCKKWTLIINNPQFFSYLRSDADLRIYSRKDEEGFSGCKIEHGQV